jgi:hypothetical protein
LVLDLVPQVYTPPAAKARTANPDPRKERFIQEFGPYAKRYGNQLNIAPEILLAIGASESNWGASGTPFGVKGKSSSGKSKVYDTWEMINGQRVDMKDEFAYYDDPDEAFRDWITLITDSPRYRDATARVKATGDAPTFLREINDAGYATDRNWANSIVSIANAIGGGDFPDAPPPGPGKITGSSNDPDMTIEALGGPKPQNAYQSMAQGVVRKRMAAAEAREAAVDEEARARLEMSLGSTLVDLPHERKGSSISNEIKPPSVGDAGLATRGRWYDPAVDAEEGTSAIKPPLGAAGEPIGGGLGAAVGTRATLASVAKGLGGNVGGQNVEDLPGAVQGRLPQPVKDVIGDTVNAATLIPRAGLGLIPDSVKDAATKEAIQGAVGGLTGRLGGIPRGYGPSRGYKTPNALEVAGAEIPVVSPAARRAQEAVKANVPGDIPLTGIDAGNALASLIPVTGGEWLASAAGAKGPIELITGIPGLDRALAALGKKVVRGAAREGAEATARQAPDVLDGTVAAAGRPGGIRRAPLGNTKAERELGQTAKDFFLEKLGPDRVGQMEANLIRQGNTWADVAVASNIGQATPSYARPPASESISRGSGDLETELRRSVEDVRTKRASSTADEMGEAMNRARLADGEGMAGVMPPERPKTSWTITPKEGDAYKVETKAGAPSSSAEEARERLAAAGDEYEALARQRISDRSGARLDRVKEGLAAVKKRAEEGLRLLAGDGDDVGLGFSPKRRAASEKAARAAGELGGNRAERALPPGIRTKADLERLRDSIEAMATAGAHGRFWVKESAEEFMRIAGKDVEQATRMAGLTAMGSPQTPVAHQGAQVLKAMGQFLRGEPIKAHRFKMFNDRMQLMATGTEAEVDDYIINLLKKEPTEAEKRALKAAGESTDRGRKTANWFLDMLDIIDPERATRLRQASGRSGLTVDMHMMRAFGFAGDKPTPDQYDFIESVTTQLAEKLGWEPKEALGAIFTADIMRDPLRKETVEEAAASYAQAVAKHRAIIAWESAPGKGTPISALLPGYENWSDAAKARWHADVQAALIDEDGVNVIAKVLGMPQAGTRQVPGIYEGELHLGVASDVYLQPELYNTASEMAALTGYVTQQTAVPWMRAVYDTRVGAQNGFRLTPSRPMTPDELLALNVNLGDDFVVMQDGDNLFVFKAPKDVDFAGREAGTQDEAYQAMAAENKSARQRIQSTMEEVWGDDVTVKADPMATDGDYPENDWTVDPNGESYLRNAPSAQRPDVRQVLTEARTRLQASAQRHALEHADDPPIGARDPRFDYSVLEPVTGVVARQRGVTMAPGRAWVDPDGQFWIVKSPEHADSIKTGREQGTAKSFNEVMKDGWVRVQSVKNPDHPTRQLNVQGVGEDNVRNGADALVKSIPESSRETTELFIGQGEPVTEYWQGTAKEWIEQGRPISQPDPFGRSAPAPQSPEVSPIRPRAGAMPGNAIVPNPRGADNPVQPEDIAFGRGEPDVADTLADRSTQENPRLARRREDLQAAQENIATARTPAERRTFEADAAAAQREIDRIEALEGPAPMPGANVRAQQRNSLQVLTDDALQRQIRQAYDQLDADPSPVNQSTWMARLKELEAEVASRAAGPIDTSRARRAINPGTGLVPGAPGGGSAPALPAGTPGPDGLNAAQRFQFADPFNPTQAELEEFTRVGGEALLAEANRLDQLAAANPGVFARNADTIKDLATLAKRLGDPGGELRRQLQQNGIMGGGDPRQDNNTRARPALPGGAAVMPSGAAPGPPNGAAPTAPPHRGVVGTLLHEMTSLPGGIAGSLRTGFASGDLPVMRQGGVLAWTRPKETLRALDNALRAYVSTGFAEQAKVAREADPMYSEAVEAGLHFRQSGLDAAPGTRAPDFDWMNDSFMTKLMQKLPWVAGSERATVEFLNDLALETYRAVTEPLYAAGRLDDDTARAVADVINHALGYSGSKAAAKWAELNVLFSAQYTFSRFNVLADPIVHWNNPAARDLAIKNLVGMVAGNMSLVGAAAVAGRTNDLWSVNLDPESSDFLQVRVGDSRFDAAAGFMPLVKTIGKAQALAQDVLSGKKTRGEAVLDGVALAGKYFENKEAPIISMLTDAYVRRGLPDWAKEDSVGEGAKKFFYENYVPGLVSGVIDAYSGNEGQAQPLATGLAAAGGVFSVGANTYKTAADHANDAAKKTFNGKSYDQLNDLEKLAAISQIPPEFARARGGPREVEKAKFDKVLKDAGHKPAPPKNPDGSPGEEPGSIAAAQRAEHNRKVIANLTPDQKVQNWYWNGGSSLDSKETVDKALSLNIPHRQVTYKGADRDLATPDGRKVWAGEGQRLEDFYSPAWVESPANKTLADYHSMKKWGKPYTELDDEKQRNIANAMRRDVLDTSPKLDALLAYVGVGGGKNDEGVYRYLLHSRAADAELTKLEEKYGKAPAREGYVYKYAAGVK